jgi:hypothetical protein
MMEPVLNRLRLGSKRITNFSKKGNNMKNEIKNAVVFSLGVSVLCVIMNVNMGCSGPQGNTGAVGATGAAGSNGQSTVGPPGPTGPQGPAGQNASPEPSASPSTTAVEAVVNNYNEYLMSQGTDPLTPGLRCTLYNVPNLPATPCLLSTSISGCTTLSSTTGYSAVGTFLYAGALDQPNEAGTAGFNVLPEALQSFYSSDFAVTCTGYFVNTDYTWHTFDVNSDDGSLLYINGSLVVNNDGLHGATDVKAVKYLQAQVYSFQVNYFQGPGNLELIVNMDGNVLPAANLYH